MSYAVRGLVVSFSPYAGEFICNMRAMRDIDKKGMAGYIKLKAWNANREKYKNAPCQARSTVRSRS